MPAGRQQPRTLRAPDGGSLHRLETLYRDEAPRLRRRLRARVGSPEEAADLVHEAFARLLGARQQAVRNPGAFLNRVVRTPDEVVAMVDAVTADDVRRIAKKLLDQRKLSMALVGPFKSEKRFASLLKI